MPLPIDTRKKPTEVKVHVSTGEGVEIVWSDGHRSRYDFPYLRDHCPCAMCNDERQKKEENPAKFAASALLPMYKPKVKANRATAVGNYAIQVDFSDGHATGIYSFDCLREMCSCEECAKEFRGAKAGAKASEG
jgi:DUF971 family protein